MKAAIYQGVGNVEIVELPEPEPGPKDVIVKVIRSGICGSDIAEYFLTSSGAIGEGSQFGHEFAGKVVRVGSEVTGIPEGLRVTVQPMRATGEGIIGAMMVGGFSEYMKVEEAEIGYNLYPLADCLSYDDGALTEPFAVGMGGVNTSNVQPTDRALILGAGPVGLGALAGMKALGVENVIVSDLSDLRLQKAKQLGADAVHNPKETPLEEFLLKQYGERVNSWGLVDVIIDAAGAKPALESALDVTRYQSRVIVVALHKKPVSFNPIIFITKELTFKGSIGYDGEFDQVLGFMKEGKADLKPTISHRFPLSEIKQALLTANKQDEAVKVMIEMPE